MVVSMGVGECSCRALVRACSSARIMAHKSARRFVGGGEDGRW